MSEGKASMRLKFLEENDDHLLERYTLTKEQLRYTKSPMDCIELVKQDKNRHAILALDGDKLVTFFVLHEKEGVKPYSSNKQAILIRAFSTDFFEQGKGYAKATLQLLPDFVTKHFPHVNELVLGVNLPNTAAQALYKKCGFVDEGKMAVGFTDIKVMSYYISESQVIEACMEQFEEICAIDQDVIGDFSRSETIRTAVQEKRCLIQQSEQGIAGFLIFTNDFFDNNFISLIIVKPSERRKGVATALLAFYVEMADTRKIFSSTNQSNTGMHKVFEAAGFVKSGYIENLDDDDPEIIYVKMK